MGSHSTHRLDKTEGANFPFWSPDSQYIGFFTEDKLKRVAVSGGVVQTICDVTKESSARDAGDGATWNQEGSIVFATYSGPGLMRVPAAGGVPTAVTTLGRGEAWHSWPQWMPDGRHLLYLAVGKELQTSAIYVQEPGSSKRVLVTKNTTRGMWAPPGYLLFVSEGTLLARHMNPSTFQLEGEPLLVALDVLANEANGRSAFAVSQNGALAYLRFTRGRSRQLTWHDRDGQTLSTVGKPGEFFHFSLSPDEKSVALLIGPVGKFDTWVMNLSSGVLTRMTRDGKESINSAPVWSPDSQRLATEKTASGIQEVTLASGKVAPMLKEAFQTEAWSPDGRSILLNDPTASRLALLPLQDGAKLQTILDTPYRKYGFRFSPDGKYVAYSSYESGASEIYVATFPSFAVKRKVSNGGGMQAVWARGGTEVLYRAADGTLMSAEIRTGSGIEAGIPKQLFKFGRGSSGFAVSADGKRILINESLSDNDEKPEISLVLNWAADIK
jgi:Tol biopolymer transport system component